MFCRSPILTDIFRYTGCFLNGIVASADDDSFLPDSGDGLIIVEINDWDWYKEGKAILKGDKVSVYGEINKDL
ncbi:MAG: hypothetical protein PVJ39_09615 [Gammaproteobacteria bacterium]